MYPSLRHILLKNHPSFGIAAKTIVLILGFLILMSRLSAQDTEYDTTIRKKLDAAGLLLQKDANRTNAWWWGWLGGYSAATIGQVIIGVSAEKLNTRQDMFLGAATTLVGAAGQFITPVSPSKAQLRILEMPERTLAEKKEKLDAAEEFLQKRSWSEIKGRQWQMHAASGAVNLGSGLVTWLGFKRSWKDGLLNFALNTAITEAQIWSQPMTARNGLIRYQKDYLPDKMALSGKHEMKWALYTGINNLGIRISF